MAIKRIGRSTHGNLQKYENQNRLQQWLIDRFHAKVAGLIEETGAERLLDAGCGEGFGMNHLREAGVDVDWVGCDNRLDALQWGRRHHFPGLSAQVADLTHLPYADGAFPLVICLEVLEHLPDSRTGLRELARVSSDTLILSVPHEPYFRALNFLRGKHLDSWGNDPEHLQNFTGRGFRRMVSSVADVAWHGYAFPWQIAVARRRNHG